jgi:hypothetical protein
MMGRVHETVVYGETFLNMLNGSVRLGQSPWSDLDASHTFSFFEG